MTKKTKEVSERSAVTKKLGHMTNRELDALVAENIFGCKLSFDSNANRYHCLCAVGVHPNKGKTSYYIPHYSSDISAAWEVFTLVSKEIGCLTKLSTFPGTWEDEYTWSCDFTTAVGLADTAPMAICIAALRSKGIDV